MVIKMWLKFTRSEAVCIAEPCRSPIWIRNRSQLYICFNYSHMRSHIFGCRPKESKLFGFHVRKVAASEVQVHTFGAPCGKCWIRHWQGQPAVILTYTLVDKIWYNSVSPQSGYWSHYSSAESVTSAVPSLSVYSSSHISIQHNVSFEKTKSSSYKNINE